MIPRFYHRLPGPTALRMLIVTVIVVAGLVLLGLTYEWVGSTFLDSGGQIG